MTESFNGSYRDGCSNVTVFAPNVAPARPLDARPLNVRRSRSGENVGVWHLAVVLICLLIGLIGLAPGAEADPGFSSAANQTITLTVPPEPARILHSVSARDDNLRSIDSTTAMTTTLAITLSGETVNGATALARHPDTGALWAILNLVGGAKVLVTLDPETGVATLVGDPGDKFAGLAFDSSGTLYGVTGDGAATAETLFTLDQSDASATFFLALGNGSDGESLGFNPDDGLLYHASGHPQIGDGVIFESINTSTLVVTNIDITGTALEEEEPLGLTYWEGEGVFLWTQSAVLHTDPSKLFRVTAAGVPTLETTLDHQSKGIVAIDRVPYGPVLGRGPMLALALALLASGLWLQQCCRRQRMNRVVQ
jgi:hypothetical protein